MENKRFEYRTPIQIIVDHLQVPGAQRIASRGYVRELSASGCRLETDLDLKPDQEILISFVLPGGNVILNARVKVIRILSGRRRPVVAAGQFLELSETDQFKIREFIVWKEDQENQDKQRRGKR